MLAGDKPLTAPADTVGPYVYLDNRGIVFFDGRRCVMFPSPTLAWVRETIDILLDEKRATRRHGDHIFGGFLAEDERSATIFAGPANDLATLTVSADTLGSLRDQLGGRR